MKPEQRSRSLLAITRSKAKMFEYGLPERDHINIARDPARLLRLSVGMLGDLAGAVSRGNGDQGIITELALSLRFAARYFDAFAASKLAQVGDAHLLLLASAAYYLCDLPGSSAVLVSRIQSSELEMEAGGLETLLWWLLRNDLSRAFESRPTSKYRDGLARVADGIRAFYAGRQERDALAAVTELRRIVYSEGTSRELLFVDSCCAVVIRRIENSVRTSLPLYSNLPLGIWATALAKKSFIRELWPAQRLLGQQGVFAGTSAVVQMPTSAGKSRSTELIIRSTFLSERASLAIIVAPFRALCHEIRENLGRAFRSEGVTVNELSDVFQRDFNIGELIGGQSILVMTPEKLVYVLRHSPELASHIGLLILDEGHQFDTGSRGVTYELLVTSLKGMIPATAQKVLISAVITNAAEISRWLNGDEGVVATGSDLLPTERSVAFASWQTQVGQLHFVAPGNPDEEEFFVPRVIGSLPLRLRGKETKAREFPSRDDRESVALYLALRLISKGAVAIFCGRKDTATGICEMLIDAIHRDLAMPMPIDESDHQETIRLANLYERNLGASAAATEAAKVGAFTHHGNTPHGVRLSVEHAMKEDLGRFVVCTSTLAQGVNLPIRYLIVTTARQGGEKIKVRDFHNLMGRAGRSGMHTEGSVLFANPDVYDTRGTPKSQWGEFKALLQITNSEPCASTLLSVLSSLKSDGGKLTLYVDPLDIVHRYLGALEGGSGWIDVMAEALEQKWFTKETLQRQLYERRDILASIEGFLLAHWQEDSAEEGAGIGSVKELAERTLAYHLATTAQRAQLIQVFELLAANIATRVTDPQRRQVFGRTLYGVGDAIGLERWVVANAPQIAACADEDSLFSIVWPCLAERIENDTFEKWRPNNATKSLAQAWIAGESFGEIHARMLRAKATIGLGTRPRKPKVEHVVEMGENALGFDGAHVLGAISELFELQAHDNSEDALAVLQSLQKRLKYGLPSTSSILLYEAGFSDRPLALELAKVLPQLTSRAEISGEMRQQSEFIEAVLASYPQYFVQVFDRIVGT